MAINPMMESARSSGVNGMHAAFKGLKSAAREVAALNGGPDNTSAKAPTSNSDDVQDAVDALSQLKLYQRQVQASAKVVETADAVVGFLLDVHA